MEWRPVCAFIYLLLSSHDQRIAVMNAAIKMNDYYDKQKEGVVVVQYQFLPEAGV